MAYAVRRALLLVPALLAIVTLTFVIVHAAPGGPLVALSGEFSTAEYQRTVEHLYGLDRPLAEQYFVYIANVLGGDLGQSYQFKQPVLSVIIDRLPATLLLMVPATLLSSLMGIWLGLLTLRRSATRSGSGVMLVILGSYAVPAFWLAQLLILLFAIQLNWLPVQGMSDPHREGARLEEWLDVLRHLILPVLALALHHLALTAVVTRARVRDEMQQPYFRTALAKGLEHWVAVRRHALRNALLPIITVIGGRIGFIFAGAVLVETVFAWPGLGRLVVLASLNRDYPLLLGLFLCISAMTLLANMVTDLLYSVIDPRVRQGAVSHA
jgi:peptide/nickel transport system permease protein